MLEKLIRKYLLQNFFKIDLSNVEKAMANEAITHKYVPAIFRSILYSLFLLPSLLLLDTSIVVSVLIPTTMVAGTAWFSVSLASMKKKFENFGLELTIHLFVAFTLSLVMLFLATLTSLTHDLWINYVRAITANTFTNSIAALFALIVVGKLLFEIFAGSLKYDINDAMLTGQNEAAEKFFKQSLSILYTTSQHLRTGMQLQVANYSLGLAFYEVFNEIKKVRKGDSENIEILINTANKLINNPSMEQKEADKLVLGLIKSFVDSCTQDKDVAEHKSFKAIKDEIVCIERNIPKGEKDPGFEIQQTVDTRMSIVFSEMSNLLVEFGPGLFKLDEELTSKEEVNHGK